MELLLTMLTCLGFMLAGYIIGLLQSGIKITHKQEEPDFKGYNEVITENIDPEVKAYLDKMYGNVM